MHPLGFALSKQFTILYGNPYAGDQRMPMIQALIKEHRFMVKHPLRYALSLCLTLLLANAVWADNEAPVILVLGDSLSAAYGMDESEGWVQMLDRRIDAEGYPHRVVNASVSGETSDGGLQRLPKLLERHEPEWVILELGGNDGLRGYPIERLRNNLTEIVTLSRDSGVQVILVGMQIPPNYGARYANQFAELYPALAEDLDLPLVLFMLEGVATESSLMQRDGIHPNAEAQPLILENMWPVIDAVLE